MEKIISLFALAVQLTSILGQGLPPCPGVPLYQDAQEQLPHDCEMHIPSEQHYSSPHFFQQRLFNFPRLPSHPNPPVPHIQPIPNLPDPLPPSNSPYGPPMPPGMPLIIIPIYTPLPKDQHNEGKMEKRHKKHKYAHHRTPRHHKDDSPKENLPSGIESYVRIRGSLMPLLQNREAKPMDAVADDDKYIINNYIPEEYQFLEHKSKKQDVDQLPTPRLPKLQYLDGDGEIVFQKVLTDEEMQQITDFRNKRFTEEVKKENETTYNSSEAMEAEKHWPSQGSQDYHLQDEQTVPRRRVYKNGNLVYQ